jgi:hypothetical protein
MARYEYTVIGCSPRGIAEEMGSLRKAIKKARTCARRGKVPVNVNRHPVGSRTGGGRTVYRCDKRGCGGYSAQAHAGSYAAWERQQKADKYLSGSKRRRKGACPANIGSRKAPKAFRQVRR